MATLDERVPKAATVRLDAPTREALAVYMGETGATFSQAVRMLVATGLAAFKGGDLDKAYRKQAFREGVTAGASKLSEHIQDAMTAAFGDMEGI